MTMRRVERTQLLLRLESGDRSPTPCLETGACARLAMVMGFLAVFLVMRCAVFPLAFDNVQSILSFAASAGEADNYSFSFYSVCDLDSLLD